jgi:hypothetical protein
MVLKITEFERLGDYRLRLTFNDGKVVDVDISQHWDDLWGPVFEPLRDPAFFAQVWLPEWSTTISWPNGADLAPEYLQSIGEPVAQTA